MAEKPSAKSVLMFVVVNCKASAVVPPTSISLSAVLVVICKVPEPATVFPSAIVKASVLNVMLPAPVAIFSLMVNASEVRFKAPDVVIAPVVCAELFTNATLPVLAVRLPMALPVLVRVCVPPAPNKFKS